MCRPFEFLGGSGVSIEFAEDKIQSGGTCGVVDDPIEDKGQVASDTVEDVSDGTFKAQRSEGFVGVGDYSRK